MLLYCHNQIIWQYADCIFIVHCAPPKSSKNRIMQGLSSYLNYAIALATHNTDSNAPLVIRQRSFRIYLLFWSLNDNWDVPPPSPCHQLFDTKHTYSHKSSKLLPNSYRIQQEFPFYFYILTCTSNFSTAKIILINSIFFPSLTIFPPSPLMPKTILGIISDFSDICFSQI